MNPLKLWSALMHQNASTLLFVFGSAILLCVLTAFVIIKFKELGLMIAGGMQVIFGFILYFGFSYNFALHFWFFILPCLFVGFISFIATMDSSEDESEKKDPFDVVYTANNGQTKVIVNVKRGKIIYGAAGAGKTQTGYLPIFKWQAENKISGVVYDHKDFELTEFFLWMNKKYGGLPVFIFAPDKIDLSNSINVIAPRYIKTTAALDSMTKCLVTNLSSSKGGSNADFFINACAGILSGVTWRTKKENPDKCNLAHVSSFIMQNQAQVWIDYLQGDFESRVLASVFLDSIENERLVGSIKASLSDVVKNLTNKEMFAIIEHDEVDLALNKKESPANLILVNQPGYSKTYSPILSMVFECCKIQMSVRGQNPSCMTLDEAGMIWLNELYNIPALLRSFNIGTIFGIQDMVQGQLLYEMKEFKALQANLSTVMFGKANDNDSAEYYEKMFPFIDKEQESVSTKKMSMLDTGKSDTRLTKSFKEVRKVRAAEFRKLSPGQFHLFDQNGEYYFNQWDTVENGVLQPKTTKIWTESELVRNFERILSEGLNLSNNNHKQEPSNSIGTDSLEETDAASNDWM
jgi:TraM recognition site of TraD and TraG